MTGKLSILDRTGHTSVRWSTDLQETVDAANTKFNEMLAQGYTAFAMQDTTSGEQMSQFNPEVSSIVLIPRMVGG
ncbi:MAG: hypothetical protein NVS4B2_32500 [Chloroflexota bacterium]